MDQLVCALIANAAKALSSFGLFLDVIGVVLLFKFGLPEEVRRHGRSFLAIEGENEDEKRKAEEYDFWARFGLVLLIVGFLLQLISNWI